MSEPRCTYEEKNWFHKFGQFIEHTGKRSGSPYHPTLMRRDEAKAAIDKQGLKLRTWDTLNSDERRPFLNYRASQRLMWQHFGNNLHIVFATNNAAGSDRLHYGFHPQVHMQEEAGLSNRGQASIPLAFNIQSLERSFLFGDNVQNKPFMLPTGMN
jgi:hypothetical protein